MKVTPLAIPEVLLLSPRVFHDERGFFTESFNEKQFQALTGLSVHFVQDNHSRSKRGALRGLHYQRFPYAQGKLVRVLQGSIFDVVVDIREGTPTFGQWLGTKLNDESFSQLWIPPGFAHGFVALSEVADVLYKTTEYYAPEFEEHISWDDASLAIEWPLIEGIQAYLLSEKDAKPTVA